MRYVYCLIFMLIFSMNISLFAMKRRSDESESSSAIKKTKQGYSKLKSDFTLHELLEYNRLEDIKSRIGDQKTNINEMITLEDGVSQPFISSVLAIIDEERKNRKKYCAELRLKAKVLNDFTTTIQNLYDIAICIASDKRFKAETMDPISPVFVLVNRCVNNIKLDRREKEYETEFDGIRKDSFIIGLKKEVYQEHSLNSKLVEKSLPTINKMNSDGLTGLHLLAKVHKWNGDFKEAKLKFSQLIIDQKPLYLASQLLQFGADPHCTSDEGGTPLDYCFYEGTHRYFPTRDIPMAHLLLLKGGSFNYPNRMQYLGLNKEKCDVLRDCFRNEQLSLLQQNSNKDNILSVLFAREQTISRKSRQNELEIHDPYVNTVIKHAPQFIQKAPVLFDEVIIIIDESGTEVLRWQLSDLF